ncbi:MAG: ABC transporter permease, partial [Desulfovibrionaceae bacterium]|nr:ABC transporter permease [Desulfovibrionaceae bacterium]
DGRSAPAFGWPGEARPDGPRLYPSFRLYARTLEDVAALRRVFTRQGLEVYTRAEEIAAVTNLDTSLTVIFGLIVAAAGIGFLASTAGNALAGVRRKEKYLGIIRLTGYSTPAIMAFPLFQSLLTGALGTALAAGLYLGAAAIIDHLFAADLQGVEHICLLLPRHFAAALGLVLLLSLTAGVQPAFRAARIDPSEVVKDV